MFAQMILSYRQRMASLLCSMAEIYLTDCCQESDAEARCEQYLSQALAFDPESIEALQTLASVRLSQSRPSEASALLRQSLGLWTALEPGTGLWPSFGLRMNLARLLLELSLFDEALSVLQINQTEDDEDPEVWYLFGWSYYIMAAKQAEEGGSQLDSMLTEDIKELRMDAVECLETVLSLDQKLGTVSEPILAHTQELLESLRET
jgi:predicted Zn-dependent protease